MRQIKTLVILIGLLFNTASYAVEDVCMPKKRTGQDIDICEYLRNMQRQIVDTLPMKISKNITVINAVAVKNSLVLTAMASYDRHYISSTARTLNTTVNSMLGKHKTATLNMICSNKTFSALLYFGAEVDYNFIYSDGTSMTTVKAREASCKSL